MGRIQGVLTIMTDWSYRHADDVLSWVGAIGGAGLGMAVFTHPVDIAFASFSLALAGGLTPIWLKRAAE